jgi:hypothetical protein
LPQLPELRIARIAKIAGIGAGIAKIAGIARIAVIDDPKINYGDFGNCANYGDSECQLRRFCP